MTDRDKDDRIKEFESRIVEEIRKKQQAQDSNRENYIKRNKAEMRVAELKAELEDTRMANDVTLAVRAERELDLEDELAIARRGNEALDAVLAVPPLAEMLAKDRADEHAKLVHGAEYTIPTAPTHEQNIGLRKSVELNRIPTLPTSIKIGPYHYGVVANNAAINAAGRAAHDNRSGETDYNRLTITIDPELAPDIFTETLLHEILHVVHDTVGIGSNEKIVAHEMIYRTCPTLLVVLRENPGLVAFLTRETCDGK